MTEYKISSFCSLGDCVEVGQAPDGTVLVRDSKTREFELQFSHEEWVAFLKGVKAGEFDPA
ncbi:MAG: DUF397 domain-containing protein [Pseudonocardiaceae bacterium]|nr:MAG: DUF397 domain-containing protein [Pseudonocardiaceae bacterium]